MKILTLCLLVFLAGCKPMRNNSDNKMINPEIDKSISAEYEINTFAVELYLRYAKEYSGMNIFFSPYSISSALAIVCEGARGETAEEIKRVLHLPEDVVDVRKIYSFINEEMSKREKDYELKTANALWLQREYPFLPEYIDIVQRYYGGETENVDFINSAESVSVKINDWVERQTVGKIKELIPRGAITRFTRMLVTNAIYFKGSWIKEFNVADTREEGFRVTKDKSIKIPMMRRTDKESVFRYAQDGAVQILEMPYDGDDVSMILILPEEDGLKAVEESLNIQKLTDWIALLQERRVDIIVPKFKMETNYFIAKDLSEMGMSLSLTEKANFSGLSVKERLWISDVIHKAFIEVDEKGSEAAAATGVIVGVTSVMPKEEIPLFRADRPFIFILRLRDSGTILFIGRVVNPAI